ncbi:PAS domain-containing protein [Streptomyces sp. SID5474]|nr:PAS domain-containing protein [Streptomyces sp. SID5474]
MADMATVLVDGAKLVLGWSPQAEHILGYPAPETLNRPITAFVELPDDPDTTGSVDGTDGMRDRDAEPPAPRPWSGHVTARHRDGRHLELAVRICPLAHAGDRSLFLLFLVDPRSTPWWGLSQSVLERIPHASALRGGRAGHGPAVRI